MAAVSMPRVFNPWQQRNELDVEQDGPTARITRLRLHLNNTSARLLMIGEAPGHLGAKYSGIPFTSERLLVEGKIPHLEKHWYNRISTRAKPFSEPSATTIWKTAHELHIEDKIVLWNAFPWHPYKDSLDSNRTPTNQELSEGLQFLEQLINLFPDVTLLAIGRKSQSLLNELGKEHVEIRHPSMGGVPAFRKGMTALVQELGVSNAK